MKTKRTTTRRPTRKNKRLMSGGKSHSEYSKYATKFKKTCKKFTIVTDELTRVAKWGELRGIYSLLMNKKYKNSGESMLTEMKNNIMSSEGTNKDNYLKAIDCLEQGDTTVLSVNGTCTPYVNAPEAEDEEDTSADVLAPAPVVEGDEAVVEGDEAAASDDEGETSAPADVPVDEVPVDEGETSAPADVVTEGDDDDSNNEQQQEEDTLQATQPATTTAPPATAPPATAADKDENKVEEGGGRPRRKARPSRRIKSRKSKKGRMTRRKHRAALR